MKYLENPSPPRRRGPPSVYTAAQDKAASGPRLRGGDVK